MHAPHLALSPEEVERRYKGVTVILGKPQHGAIEWMRDP